MQQYLQADPTVTERLSQSATSIKGKKGREKHDTEESVKRLGKRLADVEDVIQSSGSSAA
jgi:hypothetical protein